MIDSHCHLDDSVFDADRDAVIQRALEAGVELMVAIGTGKGPPDLEAGMRVADANPQFLATVGVHPHDAAKAAPDTWKRLEELLAHPKVIAIGEIGLDYHYDFSPRDVQRDVFVQQMQLAAAHRKPIVIHTREAWDETIALLEQHWAPQKLPGIMHCFTGNIAQAEQSLALGFHLSFGGVVTFPKATDLHEAARAVPLDRILLETDAPYLAPVPQRGKRNEPAYIVHTARRLAELRGITVEDISRATTENFRRAVQLNLCC
ncbi:MAG: TatD family hydrolase [Bryobacteraceae bacterium]|jgi:TatD DNase family protein